MATDRVAMTVVRGPVDQSDRGRNGVVRSGGRSRAGPGWPQSDRPRWQERIAAEVQSFRLLGELFDRGGRRAELSLKGLQGLLGFGIIGF